MSKKSILSKLPQEIITEILIRLPVKSIGRCRSVSKPWLSLLTSSEFINSHLKQQKEQNLLLHTFSDQSLFTLSLNHLDRQLSRNLKSFEEDLKILVGSCNGLVLMVYEEEIKCLINPITLEYDILPNSPLALDPYVSYSMYGFGYDSVSNDYKVVTLSHYIPGNGYETDTFVDIYSVKMRSWKRFGSSPYDHVVPPYASGVLSNGSLHWMGWKSGCPSFIAAFDLTSDKFKEIRPPASLDNGRFVSNMLLELKGCLGIVVELVHDDRIDIWFMESYGLTESWTKFAIKVEYFSLEPLYFYKDKLLLVEDGEKFMWYTPDDGRWDDWMVNGDKNSFDYILPFSKSLVSPHFNALM